VQATLAWPSIHSAQPQLGDEGRTAIDGLLQAVLKELHRHGAEHDANEADRLQRVRNVEPETAQVLALLVRAVGARRLLEIGTSNGYSTLWLADAIRSIGGRMVSIEIDGGRSAQAEQNLQRAGLRELVELRVEDAGVSLQATPEASWDMIFLDAERSAYAGYYPDLMRVLEPGGLLAVDNALSHAEEVSALRSLIAADGGVSDALVPCGAGLLLVVREL
jgi:predicted O-methyltransferase YrrM